MDTPQIKRNNERIKRKRKNEGINRRIETWVKKGYELGRFDGIDVAMIICKHGRYTTYRSRDHKSWPPSMAEIVSDSSNTDVYYTTSPNTNLANYLSSPEEFTTRRY
jgi:hypothetical protein